MMSAFLFFFWKERELHHLFGLARCGDIDDYEAPRISPSRYPVRVDAQSSLATLNILHRLVQFNEISMPIKTYPIMACAPRGNFFI